MSEGAGFDGEDAGLLGFAAAGAGPFGFDAGFAFGFFAATIFGGEGVTGATASAVGSTAGVSSGAGVGADGGTGSVAAVSAGAAAGVAACSPESERAPRMLVNATTPAIARAPTASPITIGKRDLRGATGATDELLIALDSVVGS